jgi:hypothetical protein
MKITILIALTLFFIKEAFSQEAAFDWACSYGSSDLDRVKDIAVDADGNSYVIGGYFFTIDFDPGPEEFWLTPDGSTDIFIQKLDSEGNFIWCKNISSVNTEFANVIYTDNTGNIYITGYFFGTVDFDPGAGVSEISSTGSGDCFILKLDLDGNFIWVKSFGDGLTDSGNAIATDEEGNIYCGGTYQGTVDFDPGVGIFDITSAGEEDVFIQKLDSDGNFIWAKSIGGEDEEGVESICIDADNNIFIGGNFEGTSDFNPDAGIVSFTALGFFDDYIVKLYADGTFNWALTIGGVAGDELIELAIDNDGNLYSTGYFNSNIDVDPGIGVLEFSPNGTDFFIQKLDTDGNLLWAKQTGGLDQDWVFGMDLDESNNIYATGSFRSTTDFDPGDGVFNITSEGWGDCFIQKLNEDGEFIWAKSFGGLGPDQVSAVALHPTGDIYLTGEYENTVDFNPGAAEFYLESEGSRDIFVLKLNACSPDAVTDEITSCISYTWSNGVTYFEDNNSATQTLLNIDGCDSVVTLDLTINPVDISTTTVGGVLTSNATGATYQWLDCNDDYAEIDGETNVSYTPSVDGNYAVEVTIDDCSDTSECVVIDGVGIDEVSVKKNIIIYPNPNKGQCVIEGLESTEYQLIVYSVSGKQIMKQSINGVDQIEVILPKGQYILELISDNGLNHFSVVVVE